MKNVFVSDNSKYFIIVRTEYINITLKLLLKHLAYITVNVSLKSESDHGLSVLAMLIGYSVIVIKKSTSFFIHFEKLLVCEITNILRKRTITNIIL